MPRKKKGKVGSSFDGFLSEQGILEECEEQAVKQILALPFTRKYRLDNCFGFVHTWRYERTKPDQARAVEA
jgi:hypothetical protein